MDADLSGANLEDANLRGANLRDANLEDVDLEGANLRGANLEDANLRDANLEDANLRNTILEEKVEVKTEEYKDLTDRGVLLEIALRTLVEYPEFVQEILDMNNGDLAGLFDSVNNEANENGEDMEFKNIFAGKFYANMRKKRLL